MTLPDVLGVIVTLQLDVVALILSRVHGEPLTDAVAVPVLVTATVPAGADVVPSEVSLTNAVQLVDCEMTTADGVQVTAVEVVRRVTGTVLLVLGPLLR